MGRTTDQEQNQIGGIGDPQEQGEKWPKEDQIIDAACDKCPTKDSSSSLVQLLLNLQESNKPCKRVSLLDGSES